MKKVWKILGIGIILAGVGVLLYKCVVMIAEREE